MWLRCWLPQQIFIVHQYALQCTESVWQVYLQVDSPRLHMNKQTNKGAIGDKIMGIHLVWLGLTLG